MRSHRVIDFVVQGCSERTADHCAGPVPLSLTFSAVLQSEPQSLSWDFGDGSPTQSGRVVKHVYAEKGSFTVSLGAVTSSGPLSEQKTDFVQVRPAVPGAECSSDLACATGSCVCYQSCAFPLSAGLCLQPCATLACHLPGTTCVDLSVPGLTAPPAWRTRLCLPTCSNDQECRAGFLCRLGPVAGIWTKVCLPPFPRDVGDPCRDGAGAPDPTLCLGGLCLDIGASGYCSASCGSSDCPLGTRCARLGQQGPFVCLLRCTSGSCEGDPRLACELPNPAGQYGFEIIGPPDPSGSRYCTAKRCLSDAQCGSTGKCESSKGGFCVALP